MRRTRGLRPSTLLGLALVGASALAARPARPANLIDNGSFDAGLSGWVVTGEVSWSDTGAGAAGSARIGGSPGIAGALALSQCVPVSAGTDYELRASALVPYSPEAAGGVSLRVAWHAEGTCTSTPLGMAPALEFPFAAPAAWARRALPRLRAPSAATAASVLAVPWSSGRPSAFAVFLDDVELVTSPRFETLTLPTAASVDGARGERFRTTLTVRNPVPEARRVDFQLRCAAPLACETARFSLVFGPRETRVFPDLFPDLFGKGSGAGAVEITYDAGIGPLVAAARAETVHAERPGNGMSIPVLAAQAARTRATFVGLSDGRGGSAGTRVNAGAYNPNPVPVTVRFVVKEAGGAAGRPVERVLSPHAWTQVDALFDEALAGPVRPGASVVFESAEPVFPFLLSIDNRSGDPTFLEPRESFQP